MPAAMFGRKSSLNLEDRARPHGGPTAKALAVLLQCEVSLMADSVEKVGFRFTFVMLLADF
jgi:hypothetical protein